MAESQEPKTTGEVGTVSPKKSGWAKFGNFLMMGGFLLILIVGVIIAVAIMMLVG
ncbi:MAG: hypothetical protein PHU23_06520 [Dehalococcoidales bacterium]|nr:hypothetical protein [Dehalococcoidales bacterium]